MLQQTEAEATPTLSRLVAWINAIIGEKCPSIKTFTVGYIGEAGTGQVNYDMMILLPPKAVISSPRNWNRKEYDIHYFLVRQDKGATNDTMTPTERIGAWGSLDNVNKAFITGLMANPSMYQISGTVVVDPNSGDMLLPDGVVWLEVTLQLQVNDC